MASLRSVTAVVIVATAAGILALAFPAQAQRPLQGQPPQNARSAPRETIWSADESTWSGGSVGADYHFEIAGALWNPPPAISASRNFGIIETTIDFGSDL